MYRFFYDSNGAIHEVQKTDATEWSNLNGYAGVLSVHEERTDLVTWQASSAYNNGQTLSTGGYYYTCEVTAAQTPGQPPANLSGTTQPTWPTTIGATVGDNDLTWTCQAVDPSPAAEDAFLHKSYYTVETTTNADGTKTVQLVKTVTDAQLLSDSKTAQIAQIRAGLNNTLGGGFKSNTTGHTYVTTEFGEANMHGDITRFSLDSTLTSVQFFTMDAGWVAHTLSQLQSAFVDGGKWKDAQYSQYNNLVSQVNTATTISAVQAITWTPATY